MGEKKIRFPQELLPSNIIAAMRIFLDMLNYPLEHVHLDFSLFVYFCGRLREHRLFKSQ